MKITFSFEDDERERVMELVEAAKKLFRTARVRPPRLGADGKYHANLTTRQD